MRNQDSEMDPVPPTDRADKKWRRVAAATWLGLLLLVGCGETEPAPAPPATEASIPESGVGTVVVEQPSSPAAEQIPDDRAIVTFGDLADRVNAAWPNVRSYRTVFTAATPEVPALASPGAGATVPTVASPVAPPTFGTPSAGVAVVGATPVASGPLEAVRLVALPDRQRQTLTGAGPDDHEAIVDGETLYLRGPLASDLVPGTGPDEWLSLPLSEFTRESEAGHVLTGLAVPPMSPMASLREGLRPQELRDLGEIDVDGRACRAYAGADTTAIGTRQDITVAIDEAGLPCLIETRIGRELVSRVVYDRFNETFAIEPPADATPAAGLLPSATPIGRD